MTPSTKIFLSSMMRVFSLSSLLLYFYIYIVTLVNAATLLVQESMGYVVSCFYNRWRELSMQTAVVGCMLDFLDDTYVDVPPAIAKQHPHLSALLPWKELKSKLPNKEKKHIKLMRRGREGKSSQVSPTRASKTALFPKRPIRLE